jgi:hypothetical protein
MRVGIIGGGAGGFFAAISVKENYPQAEVIIFEKSQKLLAKVRASGGGRCNVTHNCVSIPELAAGYPRGSKPLQQAFRIFNHQHTLQWFADRGVQLITEDDGCVFPQSQTSQTIIDCFIREAARLGIQIRLNHGIEKILPTANSLLLHFSDARLAAESFDKVIVATGGSPRRKGLDWLEKLGHSIIDPVPSLFTFNMPKEPVSKLMGISVPNALVAVQGTALKSSGPLLFTHWGMSGPAILKLSALGARILYEKNYDFNIQINWANQSHHDTVLQTLQDLVEQHPQKQLSSVKPYALPERLWHHLLEKIPLPLNKKWSELGKKGLHQLVNVLANDIYHVQGKTTFKEEFVTCGGVSLTSINFNTLQSRVCPHLYFCGEVLDIDGITGGYNFQACWTTGFIAGKLG